MKNNLIIGLAVVLGYLFFLLVTMPAQTALSFATLPKGVNVSGVSGTVWQGKAQSIVAQGVPLYNVQWQLDAGSLLVGNLAVQLKIGNSRNADWISANGHLTVGSLSQVAANDITLYVPASVIMSKAKLPFPVRAAGRIKVTINELDFEQQCLRLQGNGQWLNAQVSGTQGMIDFGAFEAQLKCVAGNIMVVVQPDNLLELSAALKITPEFKTSIEGRFRPRAELPEEVKQAAAFVFPAVDAEGYRQVSFN